MINGKMTEFIDQIFTGQEIVFLYNGKKYFIQGWWDDATNSATMVLEEINGQPFANYLWEYHADTMTICAEAFLSAPLWEGKNIQQIETNVTWSDW